MNALIAAGQSTISSDFLTNFNATNTKEFIKRNTNGSLNRNMNAMIAAGQSTISSDFLTCLDPSNTLGLR